MNKLFGFLLLLVSANCFALGTNIHLNFDVPYSKMYMGTGIGQSKLNYDLNGQLNQYLDGNSYSGFTYRQFNNLLNSIGTPIIIDNNFVGSAGKIFIGIDINKKWRLEAAYKQYGTYTASASLTTNPSFNNDTVTISKNSNDVTLTVNNKSVATTLPTSGTYTTNINGVPYVISALGSGLYSVNINGVPYVVSTNSSGTLTYLVSGSASEVATFSERVSVESFSLSALYNVFEWHNINSFLRFGIEDINAKFTTTTYYHNQYDYSYSGSTSGSGSRNSIVYKSSTTTDHQLSPTIGLGLEYKWNHSLTFRGEIEHTGELKSNGTSADFYTFSLIRHF